MGTVGIEYYAFALFIAGLVCVVAIVFKVLFANVKRQQKLLDERESQLLKLYTSVETVIEEFNDQVKVMMDELKDRENRATANIAAFDIPFDLEEKEQVIEKIPRTLPFDPNKIRVAGEVIEHANRVIKSNTIIHDAPPDNVENGTIFQKFFDDTVEASPPHTIGNTRSVQTRTDAILALADEGKSDVEIASELGITRNEVLLVVGLKR